MLEDLYAQIKDCGSMQVYTNNHFGFTVTVLKLTQNSA